jgi:hypothetical protein
MSQLKAMTLCTSRRGIFIPQLGEAFDQADSAYSSLSYEVLPLSGGDAQNRECITMTRSRVSQGPD